MKGQHTFRTAELEREYVEYRSTHPNEGCILCSRESSKEFTFWKLMPNKFPYNRIALKHDMLVLKRHQAEPELTADETHELHEIKKNFVLNEYDYVIEPSNKSFPAHFHLHLIVAIPNKI